MNICQMHYLLANLVFTWFFGEKSGGYILVSNFTKSGIDRFDIPIFMGQLIWFLLQDL